METVRKLLRKQFERLDLRFDAASEKAYRRHVEEELVWHMWWTTAMAVAVLVLPLWSAITKQERLGFAWGSEDGRTVVFVGVLSYALMCLVVNALSGLRLRFRVLRCLDWELLSLAALLYGCATFLTCNWRVALKLFNVEPSAWQLDPRDDQVELILLIFVLGGSLLPNIRFHRAWTLPFGGTLMHLAYVLYTTDWERTQERANHPLTPFVLVFTLSSVAVVGGWRHEFHLRREFMAQNTNKRLNFEMEAVGSLLTMTCEAAIWISSDGSTVLRSHLWLDNVMEQDMTGRRFADFLENEEQSRSLSKALCATMPTTANWPVTLQHACLRCPRGVRCNVDVFLVDRRSSMDVGVNGDYGFLMGLRMTGPVGIVEMTEAHGHHGLDMTSATGHSVRNEREPAISHADLSSQGARDERVTLRLSANAEVIVGSSPSNLAVVPVAQLERGCQLYSATCDLSCLAFGPTTLDDFGPAEASENSVIEVIAQDGVKSTILLDDASSLMLKSRYRRLSWLDASKTCMADDGFSACAVDLDTIDAGLSTTQHIIKRVEKLSMSQSTQTMELRLSGAHAKALFVRFPEPDASPKEFFLLTSETLARVANRSDARSAASGMSSRRDHASDGSSFSEIGLAERPPGVSVQLAL
eukprot:TRINITY_DN29868_c0_g2_i1.p1 TRINITY_DN29868_c0_g2~~TRINITY_DN29868_c0_g2_i1.p1  ORF type:complete len:641 (-),score=42.84 TRINITY_DN29868_c0_g2_i1:400-2322(-)